jgi:general secretion pathway protein D
LKTVHDLRFLSKLAYRPLSMTAFASMVSCLWFVSLTSQAQLLSPPPIPSQTTASGSGFAPIVPASSVEAKSMPSAAANPTLPPVVPASGAIPPKINSATLTQLAPANPLRDQAVNLTAQARLALNRGDVPSAKTFIEKANALRVPESAYATGQLRPWEVALEIDRAERLRATPNLATSPAAAPGQPPIISASALSASAIPLPNSSATKTNSLAATGKVQAGNNAPNPVVPAGGLVPAANGPAANNPIATGVYTPKQDETKIQTAAAQETLQSPGAAGPGESLYRDGVSALSKGDRDLAMKLFTDAWKYERDLDPQTRAQLKDKLTLLQGNQAIAKPKNGEPVNAIQQLSQEQNLARQKMWREVTTEIAEAEALVNDDPNAALDRLQLLRQRVSQSSVDGSIRKAHLAMVDRVITNIQAYIELNKPAIDQQQRNRVIEDQRLLEAATTAKVDSEVQSMVDQYNDLFSKGMYAEAEIIAKKVGELSPGTEISTVMATKATIARRNQEYEQIRALKNEGIIQQFQNVDESAIPMDDNKPLNFGDLKEWDRITRLRRDTENFRMTPAEKAIRERLVEPVDISFDGRPLSQAMQTLSEMTGIPIFLDPLGLSREGVATDEPISLHLNNQSVSLKSALNLMLEHLGLVYVIKDEVLKITSRDTADGTRTTRTYPVKDLVIPIPNFVADYNTGMAGALQSAYQAQSSMSNIMVQTQDVSTAQLGNQRLAGNNGAMDPNSAALGQLNGMPGMGGAMPGMGGMPGGMMRGNNPPMMGSSSPFLNGNGGNGLGGGGSMANFTELINLIQTTVKSNWQADGGEDTIQEFPSNLSLIVNAPLETHEAIAELLRQLRSLQNLQVTIEVKFITLSDNFFEQMGLDFDFNIADKKLFDGDGLLRRNEGSTTIGIDSTGAPTANLDIQFRNGSIAASTPPFAAPDANTGASLGFAILSDLELFFFLQAVQGDSRTNVMQAPKVTMFDGQFASVFDFASRPFVISLQPVVGDFAVAQQPIIVVLNDGTILNVQSVVSSDKRFVRMTLNPSFTRIQDADRTFTFTGRKTSKTGSTVLGPDGKPTTNRDDEEEVTEGSTVQLPTLGVTSVQTTVNVPDGGTILLGGIKRLQEGRTERGVPILSKIPYVNRLFKNVGIGRTTNTLMMTVTPRIIIPEEEEANVIGTALP